MTRLFDPFFNSPHVPQYAFTFRADWNFSWKPLWIFSQLRVQLFLLTTLLSTFMQHIIMLHLHVFCLIIKFVKQLSVVLPVKSKTQNYQRYYEKQIMKTAISGKYLLGLNGKNLLQLQFKLLPRHYSESRRIRAAFVCFCASSAVSRLI